MYRTESTVRKMLTAIEALNDIGVVFDIIWGFWLTFGKAAMLLAKQRKALLF
jgi:hypothetical protein